MAQILIVEDEQMLRATLRAILQRAGHEVAEAEDGAKAMKIFQATRPDLVITDIIMPNREGVETIGEMRAIAPDLPIIAMSGGGSSRGGELFLELASQLGATRTLTKPIRLADLFVAGEACLAGIQRGGAGAREISG
jgi:DNA-binding response OmpR family regulator